MKTSLKEFNSIFKLNRKTEIRKSKDKWDNSVGITESKMNEENEQNSKMCRIPPKYINRDFRKKRKRLN